MKNKALLWIGIASAILIGGGIYMFVKNRSTTETDNTEKEPVKEEEKSKKEEAVVKTETPATAPSLPSTPFRNKAEGDAFRKWMSVNNSDYRYKGQILDKSGDYDNSFMKDAFDKYGKDYLKTIPTPPAVLKSGSPMYLKVDNTSIFTYPQFKGDYLLGNLSKSWLLDKPFGKFIADTGNGFIKFETIGYSKPCAANEKCQPFADKKIAYISKTVVSNKPY